MVSRWTKTSYRGLMRNWHSFGILTGMEKQCSQRILILNNIPIFVLAVSLAGLFMGFDSMKSVSDNRIRVPAEWETHAATWMQWPGQWEESMRPAFAEIIKVVQAYEPVHLLTSSETERAEAGQFLADRGVPADNITWHIVPVDNSWMRDNGPIYVTDGNKIWIQNWKFDAWGGNFGGDVEYRNDDRIPFYVGEYLGLAVEDRQGYVLEKGNLEVNGAGILVIGWDCQDDRNPGMSQAEHEAILKDALGVSQILWAHGHWPGEGTTGHIDGTARFIDENTLAVADYSSPIDFDGLAADAEAIGLQVVRFTGDVNWLVGNGFVVAMGEGGSYDRLWKEQLEDMFPGRDVYMIDGRTIADAGGGIHCITNDQPALQP